MKLTEKKAFEILDAYIAYHKIITERAKNYSEDFVIYRRVILEPFNPIYFGRWLQVNYPDYMEYENILHKNLLKNYRLSTPNSQANNQFYEDSYEDD